jgi:hypothetical protein
MGFDIQFETLRKNVQLSPWIVARCFEGLPHLLEAHGSEQRDKSVAARGPHDERTILV